jgi:hypothetical protein
MIFVLISVIQNLKLGSQHAYLSTEILIIAYRQVKINAYHRVIEAGAFKCGHTGSHWHTGAES